MKTISRAEAKSECLKFYFTGKPCKYGHIVKRYVSTGVCFECKRLRGASDESKQKKKQYNLENAEAIKQYQKQYQAENAEAIKQYKKQYRSEKPEVRLKGSAKRRGAYIASSLDDSWDELNEFCINEIGLHRNQLTEMTGIEHHVDHIIPIALGGVHAYFNLRVIPASQNVRMQPIALPEETKTYFKQLTTNLNSNLKIYKKIKHES
ncbi:hypothetical protein [uncultured Endozoicomonas sp.]|uniref:hypothetical protein n=1 Tax=uncultured Endozoicomonas sp. TaxID=432652 RepID=UPI002616099E|nr:hypothetical protein [uncultured Endozoicomonas sp.]